MKEAGAAAVEGEAVDFPEVDADREDEATLQDVVTEKGVGSRSGSTSDRVACWSLSAGPGEDAPTICRSRGERVLTSRRSGKIVTSRPRLIEVMAPYARIPEHLGPADFRPCSGKVCADSAFYTLLFAELVWRALRTVVVVPARTRADPVPEGGLPAGKPSLPLWCAMVTKIVSLKSEEGQEPGAKEAVRLPLTPSAARGTSRGSASCQSGCGTTRTPKCLSYACS